VTPVPVKATVGAVRPVELTSVKYTSVVFDPSLITTLIDELTSGGQVFTVDEVQTTGVPEVVDSLVVVGVLPTNSMPLDGETVIPEAALPADAASVMVTVELNANGMAWPLEPSTYAQLPGVTLVVPGAPETVKLKAVPAGAGVPAVLQTLSVLGAAASSVKFTIASLASLEPGDVDAVGSPTVTVIERLVTLAAVVVESAPWVPMVSTLVPGTILSVMVT
jgi:hypothetical protein